ncbi:MAG TPA: hypothetical protein DCY07_02325 [Rhodospirillaceae bacterium]|nr:hypothetical protein [Rhodospirillaceae bacterium]
MIIVCQSCKTSFLVPASVFNNGVRLVRCARCQHTWREFPPQKGAAAQPTSQQTPHNKVSPAPVPTTAPVQTAKGAEPIKEPSALDLTETPAISKTPKTPFDWNKPLYILKVSGLFAGGMVLFLIAGLLTSHRYIAETWPSTKPYYQSIGLGKPAVSELLILQNVTSERRYIDGAMQLVVQGEIHNKSQKTQKIPPINVEALGPDERVIQSWRIPPAKATLSADSFLPFSSSIVSPEGTVTEVNLTFTEMPNDEH